MTQHKRLNAMMRPQDTVEDEIKGHIVVLMYPEPAGPIFDMPRWRVWVRSERTPTRGSPGPWEGYLYTMWPCDTDGIQA